MLLPDTAGLLSLANEALRQAVAKPTTGACPDFHGLRRQTHFLVKFAVKRFFRRLTRCNTPLGELPGILPNTPRPEQLSLIVGHHDANIGTETICIYHFEYDRLSVPRAGYCSTLSRDWTIYWEQESGYAVRLSLGEGPMALAIFDLDNTLLGGDSDHAWGEFACELGIVDRDSFRTANDEFYRDYKAGTLDIDAYLRHALSPLAGVDRETADAWHRRFMRAKIESMLLPGAEALVQRHREQGDHLLIVTATNRFITEPIALRLGIEDLIACEAELVNGHYTGEPIGIPSYAGGKVVRLEQWLQVHSCSLEGSWFYSDSHNDIPLLEVVDHPVAVDPDPGLRALAEERGWPVISLRD